MTLDVADPGDPPPHRFVSLHDLEPNAVAREVDARIHLRLDALARLLADRGAVAHLPPRPRGGGLSGVAEAAADLTVYAQRGAAPEALAAVGVLPALSGVCTALLLRAMDATPDEPPWVVESVRWALWREPPRLDADPVHVALGGALSRWLVTGRNPLSVAELAGLAGVEPAVVRAEERGRLPVTVMLFGGRREGIAAAHALPWLADRRIPNL